MNGLLVFLATNAAVATALAAIGLIADRLLRWPGVRHLVWAAVLLQLLVPSIISIGVSLPHAGVDDAGRPIGAQAVAAGDPELENAPAPSAAPRSSGSAPATSRLGPPRLSVAAALAAIELAGGTLLLAAALTRVRRVSRLVRATVPASDALQQRARCLADRIGLRKLPRLRVTEERVVPMLVALPVPTIVISGPLLEALDREEVDALLCHELAHVRRGDAWLRPVELLATAFYWWLPTLWLARGRLRRAEEAACDRIVVDTNPAARRVYAESLLKVIELTTPIGSGAIATGSADARQIKERITMILKSSEKQAPRGVSRLAAAFAVLAVLVGPTWAPAQPQRPAQTQGAPATQSQQQPQLQAPQQGSAQAQQLQQPEAQAPQRAQAQPQPQAPQRAQAQPQPQAPDEAAATRGGRDGDLERTLIEMRLRAYTIENQIKKLELSHEIARIAETLELWGDEPGPNAAEAKQLRRELERLQLERNHLDVQLDIRRIETELEMRAHGFATRG